MTNEHYNALVDAWERRVEGQGLKKGTKTYQRACLEFFMGAHALANVQGEGSGIELVLVLLAIGRSPEKRHG